mmetsp:Transcript_62330/g.129380  ORF Transcript_62330/g.129380 Transcript_62330/m.129380 type:complete len:174 (-) Transcript_62330:351-872(-)
MPSQASMSPADIAACLGIAAISAGNGHMTLVLPIFPVATGLRRRIEGGRGGDRPHRGGDSRAREEEDAASALGDSAVPVVSEVTVRDGLEGETEVTAPEGLEDGREVTALADGLVVIVVTAPDAGLEERAEREKGGFRVFREEEVKRVIFVAVLIISKQIVTIAKLFLPLSII